ncbi:hydrogenase maturation protease [bacterium]|nr:hydrogenase maturation protease [bacterium]
MAAGSVRIFGLGNPDRGDDAAGLVLAEALKRRFPGIVFSEIGTRPEAWVLAAADDASVNTVLFVDASDFGGIPGGIRLFDAGSAGRFTPALSSHQPPLGLFMEWLEEKGKKVYLIGLQPASLAFGGPLSEQVAQALRILEEGILSFLSGNEQD